ncbi:MAG: hypothetical protein ACFE9L_11745 [Candidatus Hodarchaeota archaeon]
MSIDLGNLFFKTEYFDGRIAKNPPSLRIISGIIGRCWIECCRSPELSKLLGVSQSTISFAINNHLQPSELIYIKPDASGKRRFYNHLNFEALVKYFIDFSNLELSEKETKEILDFIQSHSKKVGELFLEEYVLNGMYEQGLWYVRNLYEKIPELLILMILSLYGEITESELNKTFLYFLKAFYREIMKKIVNCNPKLEYVWIGFLFSPFKD